MVSPSAQPLEKQPHRPSPAGVSVELFAGAGGLLLGTEQAGFAHLVSNERDARACETLRRNGSEEIAAASATLDGEQRHRPLIEGDCRAIDWTPLRGRVDLVAGGPPCQPFSIGGVHRGDRDERNLWPEALRAVDEIRPRAFLFENVRGFARPTFRPYLDYVVAQLEAPHVRRLDDESWQDHAARLARESDRKRDGYRVTWTVVNAADYGVPQLRHRVIFIGYRADLALEPEAPRPTHSRTALLDAQADGSYWEEHGLTSRSSGATIGRIPGTRGETDTQRWRTLRDAVRGLPEPRDGREHPLWINHVGVKGARLYAGHSGSRLDWPAKSVKAGVHGNPGGEHIVVRDDGTYRYWTVRETARIQGFPDDHAFVGPRSEAMRQIGNAVPVPLARAVAASIATALAGTVHAVAAS